MKTEEQKNERRKHQRFNVQGRAFVMIGPSDSRKLYHIIDISQGGLAFRYFIDNQELEKETLELGILSGQNIYVEHLSSRTVFDSYYSENEPHYIKMKRRSVQFLDLTPEQNTQLIAFINDLTTGQK